MGVEAINLGVQGAALVMLHTLGRFRRSPTYLQAIPADCCSAETDNDIAIHDSVVLISAKLRREMRNTKGSI